MKELFRQERSTHGMTKTKVYIAWRAMIRRCYYKKDISYERYGGRGVRVCDRWNLEAGGSFENFLADMGEPKPGESLDKDKKGGIGCAVFETCCWLTKNEQARHKRNNRFITHQGRSQCLSAWADENEFQSTPSASESI